MAPEDPPTSTRPPSRRRKRSTGTRRTESRLWPRWRVEIMVAVCIALGLFLLVEKIHIRQTAMGWLRTGIQGLGTRGGVLLSRLTGFLQNASPSDLVGFTLLFFGLAFVVWRIRWRLMTMPRFTERKCPVCGSDLHRIHRRWDHRLLNRYVPVRRYQCRDGDCHWRGLRVHSRRNE